MTFSGFITKLVCLLSEWWINFYWAICLFLWTLHFCVAYTLLSSMTSFSETRDIEIDTWLNVASPSILHILSSWLLFQCLFPPWVTFWPCLFGIKAKKETWSILFFLAGQIYLIYFLEWSFIEPLEKERQNWLFKCLLKWLREIWIIFFRLIIYVFLKLFRILTLLHLFFF